MKTNSELITLCSNCTALEQGIYKQTAKELDDAIKNNIQDIETLDYIADRLFDTMLGLSGKGECIYLKFIKYLETFDPIAAQRRKDDYEDSLDYKVHIAYAAARLAKELHKGQVDKAGKDYFEGHLSYVGGHGFSWKEKTVGFLHDAAEDTDYSVKEIIRMLKKVMVNWKNDYNDDWIYDFTDIIISFPNDKHHKLTKAEWDEIEEALNLINSHSAASREVYIERFRGHQLAINVKLNDLRNNMDISRLPYPTEKDLKRVERYKKEYDALLQMLQEFQYDIKM